MTRTMHCVQKKNNHSRFLFFYTSVENVQIYTRFLGYVYEELGIPSKSKLNINCIQIFTFYHDSVKRIVYKHVNMTSELRHR